MDIDFYVHETKGLACNWAKTAKAGDIIGVMGPPRRFPLRQAKNYLIGAELQLCQ
ncbi:siderophore-interacting protein [Paenochrobactrum sp. BZR 201-1]